MFNGRRWLKTYHNDRRRSYGRYRDTTVSIRRMVRISSGMVSATPAPAWAMSMGIIVIVIGVVAGGGIRSRGRRDVHNTARWHTTIAIARIRVDYWLAMTMVVVVVTTVGSLRRVIRCHIEGGFGDDKELAL